jgi:hypothetical protein
MGLAALLLAAVGISGCGNAPSRITRAEKEPDRDDSGFKAGVEAYLMEANKVPVHLDWSHFDAVMENPDQVIIDSMGRVYSEVQQKLSYVRHRTHANQVYLLNLPYFMAGCRLMHFSRLASSPPLSVEDKQGLEAKARELFNRDATTHTRRRNEIQPLLSELCDWLEAQNPEKGICVRRVLEWLEAQLIATASIKRSRDGELSLPLVSIPHNIVLSLRTDPQTSDPRIIKAAEKYVLFHRFFLDPLETSSAARDKAAMETLWDAVEIVPDYLSRASEANTKHDD